ncbi:maltose permease MAL31 [Aspergillus lentulus]|uniref:Maltose permease MAL31 n=1 Tax=Aspergillus lentulus TaxID=293939 RepID=A0AAN4TER7_ASPLE|nr:maltose permease MAL31 [Aspergillus lentulus]
MDSSTASYSEPPCPLQQLPTQATISPSTLDPKGPASYHLDTVSSTSKTTYGLYDVWGCDTNSTNGLLSSTARSSESDLFYGLSTLIPGLRQLDSGARAATNAERKITFLDGCRRYPKAMAWSVVVSSTLIMEGFDTLLIFSFFSLPAFKRHYGLPSKDGDYEIPARWQFGLSTGAEAGEIVGLLLNGLLADRVGYRITISVALVLLFFSIFLPFFAVNLQMLLAGQILCGIPWGVFQTLTINYAAEVMPVALRAYLLSSINMCWVLGQLLATGVTRSFANNESTLSFRLPFGLQWAIGLPILVGVILAPESPWWLIRHDRPQEAKRSLARLTGGGVSVNETAAMLTHTNEVEKHLTGGGGAISYLDCFKRVDLRRTEITCIVWVTQQVCGSSLMGWAAYYYQQAGFDTSQAFNLTIGTFGLAIAGGVISWFLMPHVGRRRLYLSGLFVMFLTLLTAGCVSVASTARWHLWALGSLLIFLTFVYNITIGPICYVLVAEIPSTRLRVKTVVLARVAYNLSGVLINWMTPNMLSPDEWDWKGKSCFFFAGTTLLCLIWCYWRLPETHGLSYLEIDILFEKKAKTSKFRELQTHLRDRGYFGLSRDECPFRGY